MIKKILVWGVLAFIIFFIAFRPSASMAVVKALGEALIGMGNGIARVFS